MKKTFIAIFLACISTQAIGSIQPDFINNQKIASTHFAATQNDCIIAPKACLFAITPSKWNSNTRTYNIEKICDYTDAQFKYTMDLTIKNQLIRRTFLATKFCNGIATISDMNLPFAKTTLPKITDPNDGKIFLDTVESVGNNLVDILKRMHSLAKNVANGASSNEDLNYLNTQFSALLADIDRISIDTNFNGISIYNVYALTITHIPIHKNTYTESIPVKLINTTTGNLGLNINELTIYSSEHAQAALLPLENAKTKIMDEIAEIRRIRPSVEAAARDEEIMTSFDLTGPQFIVHQESRT